MSNHEQVRQLIKDYYKDKELNNIELNMVNRRILSINSNNIKIIDLLKYCTSYLDETARPIERLYHILNDLYNPIICQVCNTSFCKFRTVKEGYTTACSKSCSKQTDKYKEKIKQTYIEKYGVENLFQSELFKQKTKHTIFNKYGVSHPAYSKIIQEKKRQTCIERYGVDSPLKNKDIRKKCENTCLEKFKSICSLNNSIIKNKAANTIKENRFNQLLLNKERLNNCTPMFDLEEFKSNKMDSTYKWKWKCNECLLEFYDNLNDGSLPYCPSCHKRYGSTGQKEIFDFLYNYTNNISINNREYGIEIDLLLKDYNIGIEFNGNYWHSESNNKDCNYHLNKTTVAYNNGISLIHIYEDEWLFKKDIVKSILLDKLNIYNNIYDSNDLHIYQIKDEYARDFLNTNHLEGYISGTHYGLCTDTEIIYMISIQDNNIVKYCSKLYTKVDNIDKLFKYLNINNLNIICDVRYDFGENFKSIGFKYKDYINPTCYYIKDNKYHDRLLECEIYQDKIWNCGNLIYEYIY